MNTGLGLSSFLPCHRILGWVLGSLQAIGGARLVVGRFAVRFHEQLYGLDYQSVHRSVLGYSFMMQGVFKRAVDTKRYFSVGQASSHLRA